MNILDGWLPETLPAHWKFPAPPVVTRGWSTGDWVRYAAPYNALSLELMRIERETTPEERRGLAHAIRVAAAGAPGTGGM